MRSKGLLVNRGYGRLEGSAAQGKGAGLRAGVQPAQDDARHLSLQEVPAEGLPCMQCSAMKAALSAGMHAFGNVIVEQRREPNIYQGCELLAPVLTSRTLARQPHNDTSSSATSPLACMRMRKEGMHHDHQFSTDILCRDNVDESTSGRRMLLRHTKPLPLNLCAVHGWDTLLTRTSVMI